MNQYLEELLKTKKNFVFLGEAGCGKTEAAINFAVRIKHILEAEGSSKTVHFFDLDQTKPMFRSRDVCEQIESEGVKVHFEHQVMDARTQVGGTETYLKDPESITILDIGGDHQGSRMIGGFAPLLKRGDTKNYFMINPYRPWSKNIEAIDRTMAGVIGMAGIGLEDTTVMANPNYGLGTTIEEIVEGYERTREMLDGLVTVESVCAKEELAEEAAGRLDVPVIPIKIYMKYDWV